MAVNIFKDWLRHAELFGKPVVATDRPIPRETVPDGWFCYDMQATGRSPDASTALVDYAAFSHRGSVLSPTPLKRPSTAARWIGNCLQSLDHYTVRLNAGNYEALHSF